jgi:hypothetical protein
MENNKLYQSDIRSLGFDLDQATKDGAYFYYGTMMDKVELLLHCHNDHLRFDHEDYSKIIITDLKSHKTLFDGVCETKEDLEKELKKIGL